MSWIFSCAICFPLQILSLFAVYVVHYPRIRGKERNTASYAEGCLRAVRDDVYSRHRRYPGPPPGTAHFLGKVLRTLNKRAPSGQRAPRLPILQQHLRAIRSRLDLAGNGRHRALRALWLTCWQGVCR